MSKKEKMTNKEYLICLDTKLDNLAKQFANHLKHHFMVALSLLSTTGALIVALIIALLRK